MSVVVTVACLVAMSGCGRSAQVKLEAREIAYQTRIGRINEQLARSSTKLSVDARVLRRAIADYKALVVPSPLRKLNAEVITGLNGELRTFEVALSRTTDQAHVHAAEALGASSRAAVSRALGRMATIIGACRANASNC